MNCNKCGRNCESHANFCSTCGEKLGSGASDPTGPGFNLIWVGFATLVLFAFVSAMLFLHGRAFPVFYRVF